MLNTTSVPQGILDRPQKEPGELPCISLDKQDINCKTKVIYLVTVPRCSELFGCRGGGEVLCCMTVAPGSTECKTAFQCEVGGPFNIVDGREYGFSYFFFILCSLDVSWAILLLSTYLEIRGQDLELE